MASALAVSAVLVSTAATDPQVGSRSYGPYYISAADTDTVAVQIDSLLNVRLRLDSLIEVGDDVDSLSTVRTHVDSLLIALNLIAADTLAPIDTVLIRKYFPPVKRDAESASIFPRRRRPFSTKFGRYWIHSIEYDTLAQTYTSRERVGQVDVRHPTKLDFNAYRQARLWNDVTTAWKEIVLQRSRQQTGVRRGGLGFSIVVPGGRQSAFTTIFGTPGVELRVNGQADIKAGFDYRKSDQQVSVTGKPAQLDPNFKQDLRLGIQGTIGDKLRIDVQYDSKNQFDYENQLKLVYTGYDDEIIQKIEAGNVFLQTPSTLIRGGQSLFGIKSEFRLGGVRLTTVASQQEGQTNSLEIKGGSESTPFDLKPTDYDDATHFFLSYYFRNRWEDAHVDPPTIRLAQGFDRITEIEVWRLEPTRPEELNVRQLVAVVDLAESTDILDFAAAYTNQILPNPALDQYDDTNGGEVDTDLRNGNASPGSYLEANKGLTASDYQIGKFKRLESGRDYDFDPVLGFLSLNQRLQETEALAVAFRFRANGQTFQVGDFSTDTGGSDGGQSEDKLVLKLIRPVQLRQPAPESGFDPAAWYLELRNIYNLPARGISGADFELQIYYEPPGKTVSKSLPGVGGSQTLLQILGLDRVNEDQGLSPDDLFDFLVNYTIKPASGELIFPVLEPFGAHIDRLIDNEPLAPEDAATLKNLYVYEDLYQQKKANARRDSQHDVFQIRGSSKGTVQEFYNLQAYAGLIPGSVRVTSGGTPLQENADFVVDYSGGTLTITNPAFLIPGRELSIDYEQNSLFNLQKKTLLGMRMDYSLDERFSFGATLMKMNQKSPIDKYRIGEEPISNMIWGVDGAIRLEPRWLTQAIDFVPLLQTREPSSISLTGEFAQLRPNHIPTIAFERTRRELRQNGRDFSRDELRGTSYIDDFEGFENTFALMQPGTWSIASAPDSIGVVDELGIFPGSEGDSLRTNWRGTFGWYRVNANTLNEIPATVCSVCRPESIKIFRTEEVFPNRDVSGQIDPTLETFDMYFSPYERGPYNYTRDLGGFLADPKSAWGGMSQRLPEGFTDFSLKNIDFVEFVFQPFPENAAQDAGRDAKLYIDMGSISEDILPDEKLNNEDGLSMSEIGESSILIWGRSPNSTQNSVVDIDDGTKRTEDLGIDGLASYGGDYPPFATEQEHFKDFLASLDTGSNDPRYRAEAAKAFADPSGDDYHYFGNSQFYENPNFFPSPATFQQRFSRYFAGLELNSFEGQTELATNSSQPRGNSRFPDSEDRNLNSTVDIDNSYFQYEVPLSKAVLDSLAKPELVDDYVIGEVTDEVGNGTGWYQIRIPVQKFGRKVGEIQDFSLVESIRLWTTGHEAPITMRFASLELVGSQWQKSERIASERETEFDAGVSDTRLTISSINDDENAGLYVSPIGAVVSQTRTGIGGVQKSREQSLVLRAENLRPGRQRAIFKTQNQGLDLLKYSNVRMFIHMHGQTMDGTDLATLPIEEGRQKAKIFVRFGSNESSDYYEYEQPLTPSSKTAGSSDQLWQTNTDFRGVIQDLNSVNIKLAALNQLKVSRDRLVFPTDSVFYNVVNDTLVAPDVPDAETFAPPGTRLAIRGTPSLGRINSIVIGIRNPADSTDASFENILEDVTIWVNELRVAGYDEANGWAAVANADIKLADLGRIKANIQTQTDGFGSLSSSLGEREQNNLDNWSVTTELSADKLIPERFGWTIPISYQIQSNTTTPRFSPTRGDIRLEEIIAQLDERDDLDNAEKEDLKAEARVAAQTFSSTRSFSARVGKSNSRSPILRNTIDGIGFNYSRSQTDSRSPSQSLNDSWRWLTSLSYRFASRKPHTIRPFWFLDSIPVLSALGELQFNYVPNSVTTSTNFSRNFSETKERPNLAPGDTSRIPLDVRFPLREKHAFAHARSFSLQYNPFGFLSLSFDINTNQSLNAVGVDTLFNVVTPDTVFSGLSISDAISQGLLSEEEAANANQLTRLQIRPANDVLRDFLTGSAGIRAEKHDQTFTGSFAPRFASINALDWFQIQDISYRAQYSWSNGPVGRATGAAVQNNVGIRGGVSLKIQELWRKFGFYQTLEDKQRDYENEKRASRSAARTGPRARPRQPIRAPIEEEEEGEEEPADDKPETVEEESGGGFRLPLPNFAALGRQFILAVTGIRDFTITYDAARGSASSNVGIPIFDSMGQLVDADSPFSIFDAYKGKGPSPAYRFGLIRKIDLDQRIIDPSLQVSDVLSNSNRFQARTALNPSQKLQINLNWNLDYEDNETSTFRPIFDENSNMIGVEATSTLAGTNNASVWAFGASYLEMFKSQLSAYRDDLLATPGEDPLTIGDANGDGRLVLTNESVSEDFRRAFINGGATLDSRNLLPFPRPNWNITYSGISDWPLVKSLVRNMTLRHGYSADYSADYRTNTQFGGQDSIQTVSIGSRTIQFNIEEFQTGNIRVNERYSPALGLDITWKGQIQTNIQWNKSNSYSLSTSNFEVSENKTDEISLTGSWQKSGLKIPFLGKTIQNRVSLSITVARSSTVDQRLRLRRALETAITDPEFVEGDALSGDNISVISAHRRTTISPRIGYQFSNRVSANFELKYEKFDSQDSRQPSATNIQGNFNIRVSIAN
ncbi:MAG: cell surface protein SprA [Rhodothermia bacterium]|nr:MAG: cell surface protein SprA [Rhodothermia bacterium]